MTQTSLSFVIAQAVNYTSIVLGVLLLIVVVAFLGILVRNYRGTAAPIVEGMQGSGGPPDKINDSVENLDQVSSKIDEEGIQERPIHHATD